MSGLGILAMMPVNGMAAEQVQTDSVMPAVTATGARIDLAISGMRSEKGDVLICLSSNPKYFPDCRKDDNARKLQVSAATAGNISINGVQPGTYAVALIHDENENGKMDLRLFLPREGFGFSRNPKIGMGPPKFKSAQFTIGTEDVSYDVKMKYIL